MLNERRQRLTIALVATIVLLALAVRWSTGRVRHATPADCVDAYRAANQAGDVDCYLACLGEPLRAETLQRFPDRVQLADYLRGTMSEVKAWVLQLDAQSDASGTWIDVDEVRTTGTRRLRFRLEPAAGGWLIVGIDRPRDVKTPIPYGTHVSQTPEP